MGFDARFRRRHQIIGGESRQEVMQRAGMPDLSPGAQRNVIKVANLWSKTIQSTEFELTTALVDSSNYSVFPFYLVSRSFTRLRHSINFQETDANLGWFNGSCFRNSGSIRRN
jgi:hypothetical protein